MVVGLLWKRSRNTPSTKMYADTSFLAATSVKIDNFAGISQIPGEVGRVQQQKGLNVGTRREFEVCAIPYLVLSKDIDLGVSYRESATEILSEYFANIGGREKIFEETEKAVKGKKRRRPQSGTPSTTSKRSRRNGVHPSESTPPASAKKWSPPAGSWEDEIETIDACEDEGSGKLVVYLIWKNGQKTKHGTQIIYKKCPQKVSSMVQTTSLVADAGRCSNFTNVTSRSFETRTRPWPTWWMPEFNFSMFDATAFGQVP